MTTLGRDTLSIIGLVAWMAYIDWLMTLLAFVAGPFILFVLLALRLRLRRMSRLVQASMADLHHVIDEAIAGHRIIKIFAGRQQESESFKQKANANRRYNMKFIAASAAGTPVINVITAIALVSIVYIAAVHAAADKISVAEFNSFFAALLMLLSPLRRLSRINEDLQRGLAACESVFTFIDQETEADGGEASVDRLTGAIEINDLGFAYDEGSGAVLDNISLTVSPGQTVAIIGPSGSGKTSLVNLIPRFYETGSGEIREDGQDIRKLSLAALRDNIALVSQHVVLFNDTVFNNIAYGSNRDATPEQVREAARKADALEFVEALEKGFDTVIGNDGSRLSGGQRQRIALARAFVKGRSHLDSGRGDGRFGYGSGAQYPTGPGFHPAGQNLHHHCPPAERHRKSGPHIRLGQRQDGRVRHTFPIARPGRGLFTPVCRRKRGVRLRQTDWLGNL